PLRSVYPAAMSTPIPFRGFDERADLRIYEHGLLPHWRQDGCTYFITFRQADALPAAVLREFEHERRLWLVRNGTPPDGPIPEGPHPLRTAADRRRYQRWVAWKLNGLLAAGRGSCLLRSPALRHVVTQSLRHLDGRLAWVGDWVVMPNHVHALLTPLPGVPLEESLHSLKSFTAPQINRIVGCRGPLWQKETYDHIVRNVEQLDAFQNYIRLNPVKAGLGQAEFSHDTARYDLTDPAPHP
ncbi:transposase, partial [Alienimonas sp. DA493]|uniref:transposase n=1 Tax=Alienimonas sp. DA493 TaxID=3373605 RepID=UPI003754FD4F